MSERRQIAERFLSEGDGGATRSAAIVCVAQGPLAVPGGHVEGDRRRPAARAIQWLIAVMLQWWCDTRHHPLRVGKS
jgi:hypothetical protein